MSPATSHSRYPQTGALHAALARARLDSAVGAEKTCLARKELAVFLILAVLLIALILGGLGFAVHVLWWIALIVLAIWLLGFLFRTAEGAGSRRGRWYRW